ncbi:hypothetical protein KOW79_001515 [Hemibagrus wyckioides]|uniref:Uncharacterized protein n=1 Tax=Hemibagrus wyckioides TaxID=337641 RepID=A0A9D3P7E9_9TELE|nr:hypothetical protein KOW79_001515 [Hemibagrus wyckioides]
MRGKIRAQPDSPMYSIPTLVPTHPIAYRRSTIPVSQRSPCLQRTPGHLSHMARLCTKIRATGRPEPSQDRAIPGAPRGAAQNWSTARANAFVSYASQFRI